jgi:hypothetical protein
VVQVEAGSGSSRALPPGMGWKVPRAPPSKYCTCSLLIEFREKLIISLRVSNLRGVKGKFEKYFAR